MLTRCPQCETIFRVADQQLAARDGLVRCGRCLKVFKAAEYAYEVPVSTSTTTEPEYDEEIVLTSPGSTATEIITERMAPAASKRDFNDSDELPSLQELLWGKKRSRTRPFFWLLAILFLLAILLAQISWFFATELSRQPQLSPWIEKYCTFMGCVVLPERDIGLIELSRARVSPHPRYENVLVVRGSLINRAAFSQDFPLIEVSLSNRRGEIVGRRAFDKKLFLTKQNLDETTMSPNVRFPIFIEFINPEPSASGFEVRLVAPPLPKNPESIFTKLFRE